MKNGRSVVNIKICSEVEIQFLDTFPQDVSVTSTLPLKSYETCYTPSEGQQELQTQRIPPNSNTKENKVMRSDLSGRGSKFTNA